MHILYLFFLAYN